MAAESANSSPTKPKLLSDIGQVDLSTAFNVGSGTFANVYVWQWNGKTVAVKHYTQLQHMPFFEREYKLLSATNHQNIVDIYAKSTIQRLLLIEYSPLGSLDLILNQRDCFDYDVAHAVAWGKQAADGIAYLHSIHILHRDLKPGNMLLFNEGSMLKLTDFGTSCLQRTYLTSARGSPAWMAPEVWQSNEYDEKCDVYSWSICFWQMLSRKQPFEGCDMYQVMWKVVKGDRLPILEPCPNAVTKIITDAWEGDSSLRPTMSEVLERMNVLTKLYPGSDIPITVREPLNDFDGPFETNTFTGDRFATLTDPTDSLGLESLAITGEKSQPIQPSLIEPSQSQNEADGPFFKEILSHKQAVSDALYKLELIHDKMKQEKDAKDEELKKLASKKAAIDQRIKDFATISTANEQLQGVIKTIQDS